MRVSLRGSTHPLAQPQFDLGPAGANLQLDSMTLGLKKTAAQQTDLNRLLKDQQDLNSPQYHRWLTPEQFADRFGISRNDIDKISAWLEGSGFQVLSVGRGRGTILFSGTAGQVEQALHTPIHRYRVDGEEHFANAAAPSLPKELADLVAGIGGLNDFRPKPPSRRGRPLGKLSDSLAAIRAQLLDSQGDNLLVPDDLATIYDLGPLYKAGADGTGQTIAVVGQSDIAISDIEGFRKAFNLPVNDPTRLLVPKTTNPGMNGSMDEADLDLEWAGALAPKAQIIYVFSGNVFVSMYWAIDQNVAPVLSSSFGVCEWHLESSDFDLLDGWAQQGAAQGITWVSSSGDSGAAGCENQNGAYAIATTRMSVQAPASLPEVTAVGGSEFNEGNGAYFATKPGPNSGTALSYIPEAVWNDEGALLQNFQGFFLSPGGFAAGGGGASIYWYKPLWQVGPGVPNDGSRDVPDVSLTASGAHDPYLLITGGNVLGVGGTSASTPAFAGILALLNQYLVGTKVQSQPGLGNINPMLYFLGQNNSSVYHDITLGGNQVPCAPQSSQDCDDSGVYGYSAGPGYDLASGWGSVDASKFVATWANVVTKTARLVITSFTTSTQAAVGGSANIDVEYANQGGADAPPFEVRVLFTTDGTTSTAAGWYIYCDLKSAVPAGKTGSCSGNVTLDKSITAGTYTPLAILDYKNQVVQYDRTGNFAYSTGGTIVVQ